MLGERVVAGVFDDALANGEGQVESAEGGVALFKAGGDAQRVEVVVESEAVAAEGLVEGRFAGVAEGRVADVVNQGERFGEALVEAKGRGHGAGNLGDLKGVGEAAAGVVALGAAAGKDLSLAGQAAEGFGVEDASAVTGEGRAIGVRGLMKGARDERVGGQLGDCDFRWEGRDGTGERGCAGWERVWD
jgi:hypothetical protein